MDLFEAIGLKIVELRYVSKFKNKFDLSEFHSYLKLSNKKIINIPIYPDETLSEVNKFNFFLAKKMKLNKEKIENQVIKDFHFMYIDEELYEDKKVIIELENGYFITETNYLPVGLVADLEIMSTDEFLDYKKEEESEENTQIKSYLTEFKK